MKTKDLTKISICVSLLCVSAYIAFPLPFTPAMITAQTIIINLIALILKPKHAFIAVGVYIILGACGLPVFSGGVGGLSKLFGPTGGYLVGYLIAATVISYLKGKKNDIIRYLLVTILVGIPIIYCFGLVTMCLYMKMNIFTALSVAVAPYILGDLIKCVAGSYLGYTLNKRVFSRAEFN